MPTDPGYMARWEKKKAYYAEHGIIEGKNEASGMIVGSIPDL